MTHSFATVDLFGASASADPSPASSRPSTLSELLTGFERSAALSYPDIVVPIRALRMSETGEMVVPERGSFVLSTWARKQLATRLGVVFDRWFEGIEPQLRASEINRRLLRHTGGVRVKTNAVGARADSSGTLRALVSPGYTTIEDGAVARALLDRLGPVDPPLVRHDVTDRTTSYVVQVGPSLRLTGPARVGEVRGGVLVRNSDVGFASLVIWAHLTRCVCSNGMMVTEDAPILHRAHRRLDMAALYEKLTEGLQNLPARLQYAGRALERAGHHPISNMEGALVEVLRLARLPLRLLGILLEAYRQEPHESVFGVTQAVTLGAQHPSVGAENRHLLEQAAGEYLRRFSNA
jgi:hypothetical protein